MRLYIYYHNPGMKDFYALLQVSPAATRTEIQASYRRLAKKYHPDVNKSADAHEKFCEITEAYEFIMDHWTEQSRESKPKRTDAG